MRKIGYFGSCLSALPIATLVSRYGFSEAFRIQHNRSDAFRAYYIEKTKAMIDRGWLDDFLLEQDDPKVARDAVEFLNNQMLPTIGFGGTLKDRRDPEKSVFDVIENESVDIILLDNFMDISSKLMVPKDFPGFETSPLFLNPRLYKNKEEIASKFKFVEFLSAKESAENWRAIYKWFRARQPEAKIIFLAFPYSTSRHVQERFERARNFYTEFLSLMKGEEIEILPPLDLPDHLTNGPEDPYHVKQPVYEALAGYIFLRAMAKFPAMGFPYNLSPVEDHTPPLKVA